jgi:hypothetical protein
MVNYTNFRNLAERLIEENGRTLTLVKLDEGNPVDVAEPWRASTEADEISFDVLGVFIKYEKDAIDGEFIMQGDKQVLIAAKSVEDESGSAAEIAIEDYEEIVDGGQRWRIMDVDLIEPGPSRVLYDLQVRK